MELFILWCGFIGAWLLFCGAIYQSVLELRDEVREMDDFGPNRKRERPIDTGSQWWWLLPPVKIILIRRANDRYKKSILATMSKEQIKALTLLRNKVNGWLLVATGALLIALKETYELAEGLDAPTLWFWIAAIILTILAIGYTAFNLSGDHTRH